MKDIITEIYCDVDEFCIKYLLQGETVEKLYPKCRMSLSEVMTIVILFHHSGSRCFKWFYEDDVYEKNMESIFPVRFSYNRFVEVMQYALLPLLTY